MGMNSYQRLLEWLLERDDVLLVDDLGECIDMRPSVDFYEGLDGDIRAPAVMRVLIPRSEYEAAYPHLLKGAIDVGLSIDGDESSGILSLFDVILDEGVNSLTPPGPRGFRFENGRFFPY